MSWMLRIGAVVVGSVLLALTVYVTSRDSTTTTENALWTFILFAIGIIVSFYLGRKSIKDAAAEMVRAQARAAARRLRTLGFGIRDISARLEIGQRAAEEIADANGGTIPIDHLSYMVDATFLDVDAQMRVVVDSLDDWREFDPDLVNDLKQEGRADGS